MIRKGIIALTSVILFFGGLEIAVRYRMNLVEVVRVKNTMNQRDVITEDDLSYVKVSRHFLEDDVIYDMNDVLGLYVKMEHTLIKGTLLRMEHIEDIEGMIDAPTLLLKEDERVYTIKRDVASVSGTSVVRGGVIDIAIQLKKVDEYGVILEKVRVIGVRDRNGDEVKEGAAPYVILLAVDVADVALLLRAEEEGKLVLLPRSIHESS